MVIPMRELFRATRLSPRKSPTERLSASISSTVSVDDLSKMVKFDRLEDTPQKKVVTFSEQESMVFCRERDNSIETWFSPEELDGFLKSTLKQAIEVGTELSESIRLGWSLYELNGKYDDSEAREACQKGLLLIYQEIEELVGLESIVFDTVDDGRDRRASILAEIHKIRADPYAGDESIECSCASKRISAPAQRWFHELAEAQRLVQLNGEEADHEK
eukprot:CAMPEP_0172452318 /NCGR_PEP_ID=MMETSP1065-20121228/10030_1 /TAXON_ID=265537 /ORGANISM="Amphiprora paludosa, Strain CCMP125" /LENGTH=217 /DNA_ID=CAMNT_0013204361 /DNA_START=1 /DNA_END=654 /DNA_ORIENTATION=+